MAEPIVSPAEFEKIPLDFIIASPLMTTINAHRQAAMTTLEFVEKLKDPANNMKFKTSVVTTNEDGGESIQEQEVSVPLLALVKVPSLNFDSLSISFNYNISQIVREESRTKSAAELEVETTGLLSKFVNAKLAGNIEHTTNRENTANRGGTLDVKVHVSEGPLPAGLQKIINAITDNIQTAVNAAGNGGGQND